MKLKKILNEVTLNELGDSTDGYKCKKLTSIGEYKIDDDNFVETLKDGTTKKITNFRITIDFSNIETFTDNYHFNDNMLKELENQTSGKKYVKKVGYIPKEFKKFLVNQPSEKKYFKTLDDFKGEKNPKQAMNDFNNKYSYLAEISFKNASDYKSLNFGFPILRKIMATVVNCAIESIKDVQKEGIEVHFIYYNAFSEKDDNGRRRDILYKTFIKPRVTGYKFVTKPPHTLIQFDKIK
jgi:hypothetical protein